MMMDRLMWSSIFEQFVASKYPGERRFGLEGAESLIAGMKAMVGIGLWSVCQATHFWTLILLFP
jgi:2-oxoglutarate dehydrogenase complex dehydrogenase (E1) component-like enzyme